MRNSLGQLNIVTGFSSISIHTGEKNLPCSQILYPLDPDQSINPRGSSPPIDINFPGKVRWAINPLSVNGYHDTLFTKSPGCSLNQRKILNCRCINGNLICPRFQKTSNISQVSDTPTHRKGHKNLPGRFLHHLNHNFPFFRRSGNIKENKLIGSFFLIEPSVFYGIAGIL